MSTPPSSERPWYIEQLRSEVRGYPARPAKRVKPAAPFDPEAARYLFTV